MPPGVLSVAGAYHCPMLLHRILSPKLRRPVAWVLFAGGIVGWPLSMLTLAQNEPPFTLSLSWLAVVIEGWNGVQLAEDADDD